MSKMKIEGKRYKIAQTSKHWEDNTPWRAKIYTDGAYIKRNYMRGYVVVENKAARYISPPIVFPFDCKLSDLIFSLEYIEKSVMERGIESRMICRPWIIPEIEL